MFVVSQKINTIKINSVRASHIQTPSLHEKKKSSCLSACHVTCTIAIRRRGPLHPWFGSHLNRVRQSISALLISDPKKAWENSVKTQPLSGLQSRNKSSHVPCVHSYITLEKWVNNTASHFVPASRYSFDPGHQHLFIWRRRRRSSTNDSIQVDNCSHRNWSFDPQSLKDKKRRAMQDLKRTTTTTTTLPTRFQQETRFQQGYNFYARIHLVVSSIVSCRLLNLLCLPEAGEAKGVLIGLPSTPEAESI